MAGNTYAQRLEREKAIFADQEALHEDLPPAYHHWSNRHVMPKLAELGLPSLDEFVLTPIEQRAQQRDGDVVVFSVGSGNGNLELNWLAQLRDRGVPNVRLRLLELNPDMQERAAAHADRLGLGDRLELLVTDFNTWQADAQHDVIIGWHALHHVVDLEHLFGQLASSLSADGVLLVNDIIGRNGHRRWPEALEVVERVWHTLPPELRRNAVSGQVDDVFTDLDCATDGFEGIRAQDVLPCLLDVLHPGRFFTFANVIDPFVDRIYGHNFKLDVAAHREIIEDLGKLDDALMDLGTVTPTHLIGEFHPHPVALRCHRNRTPERAVRDAAHNDFGGRISYAPQANDPHGLITGGRVIGRINGVDRDDQWAGTAVDFPFLPHADTTALEIVTYVPDSMAETGTLTVHLDGQPSGPFPVTKGRCAITVPAALSATTPTLVKLTADWCTTPTPGGGADARPLSYVLVGIQAT